MKGIVKHPAFERGRMALLRALDTRMRGQIVFVTGLSGVGKSEIRYDVMRSFAGVQNAWGVGKVPVIAVRATPSSRSTFNSKEFMLRLYLSLFEPDLGWMKVRDEAATSDEPHLWMDEQLKSPFWMDFRSFRTEHSMRTYVERMLVARGVRALFVDEASSMTFIQARKNPVDHMINCMCLAEEVDLTLVMFGVPRMAALWEGNAEILRRSRFVFVDRYRYDRPEDRSNFQRLAVTIAGGYKFHRASLVNWSLDLAYASSAGVFGELQAFYRRADDLRCIDECESIQKRHIEGALNSESTLLTLHAEAAQYDSLRDPASPEVVGRVLRGSSGGGDGRR